MNTLLLLLGTYTAGTAAMVILLTVIVLVYEKQLWWVGKASLQRLFLRSLAWPHTIYLIARGTWGAR